MTKSVQIVPFDSRHLPLFVSLNKEWIETYFKVEPMDVVQLENPFDSILKVGGEIFFLLENGEALGTCAMVPHGKACYELAKMAVSPAARGKGYGEQIMHHAIQWARDREAEKIILLSNTVLEPAIALYKKVGFITTRLGTHPDYERCNIEMELVLG